MKTEPTKDPLDKGLAAWRVSQSLPPRFQEHVWRRIADAGTVPSATPWAIFQSWLQAAFARPAMAVACAALLLLLGSGTGWWQARQQSARVNDELGSRYVQSLDPYQKMRM